MSLKKITLLAAVTVLFAGSYYTGLWDYLTMEYYLKNREILLGYVESRYLITSAIFTGVYLFTTGLSIPGATILTLTAGYIFGYAGIIHVNIGATGGATAAFLISRYIAGESIQSKYAERLNALNMEIENNGKNYMLMLRFIFIFPFFLLNILAGLTKIPVYTFIWTTSLGILPGSFAYIYAGRQINSISSLNDIFSMKILSAFILLAAIAVLPVVIKKIKTRGERI